MEQARWTGQQGWRRGIAAVCAALSLLVSAACDTLPVLTETVVPGMAEAPSTGQVYFVTDRAPETGTGAAYGHDRSASMAFGQAVLGFDKLAVDFDDRAIRVRTVSEQVRFPATPLPIVFTNGVTRRDTSKRSAYQAATRAFQDEVARAVRAAQVDEVVLFVHGYRNDFDDALTTMANIWQATDRSVVPIAYTWPADNPGLFGYFKDRESGEFSIFHLKETLRILAGVREVRKIHVVAHSRGSDVATAALRELIIAARAAGKNPRKVLKIDNLVLAAPDLDFDIVRQRLIAEEFGTAFGNITVYLNPSDSALGLAQAVNSGTRFGRLSYADLNPADRQILGQVDNVHFVDVSNVVSPRGHSYFRENPVVLTDIVMLLQYDFEPGDPARSLSHVAANFWMLEQVQEVTFEPPDR